MHVRFSDEKKRGVRFRNIYFSQKICQEGNLNEGSLNVLTFFTYL